jgi:hypothetical protein
MRRETAVTGVQKSRPESGGGAGGGGYKRHRSAGGKIQKKKNKKKKKDNKKKKKKIQQKVYKNIVFAFDNGDKKNKNVRREILLIKKGGGVEI